MKNKNRVAKINLSCAVLLISSSIFAVDLTMADNVRPGIRGECTIGVFSADVTGDGRPVLWKNRDVVDFNQRFVFYQSYNRDGLATLPFIGNVYRADTSKVYMGVNGAGFAIVNSDSYNLDDSLYNQGITDGVLIRLALETCRTLEDFEALLDSTDIIGRDNCWNFGVFDTRGDCAVYECANFYHLKFSPDDLDRPNSGYMIRTNFSLSGGNLFQGRVRYKQAVTLTENRLDEGPIDIEFVLKDLARDLRNTIDDPYPLPYLGCQEGGPPGYISNLALTISNKWTSSAIVIRGTRPDEDKSLATTFAMLGSPILSVAYPLWVKSGTVPLYLGHPDGAPMYEYCWERRGRLYDNYDFPNHLNSKFLLDDNGGGIYSYTLPLETWGIEQADDLLEFWNQTPPEPVFVSLEQMRIGSVIFTGFQMETDEYIPDYKNRVVIPDNNLILSNYPNPFNSYTGIAVEGIDPEFPVVLRIYDNLGRLVREFDGTTFPERVFVWEGKDNYGNDVSSGVYYYQVQSGGSFSRQKMLYLK